MMTQSTKRPPTRTLEAEPLTSVREDDDGDDEPGDPQEGHRELRDPFDAVDEIVAPARRLGPGDRLAPPFLLALLLFEALLLQLLQALDAFDGGRLLPRCRG